MALQALVVLTFALLVVQAHARRGSGWDVTITYDFYCTNNEFGKRIGLVPRSGFLIDTNPAAPASTVKITAKVRNTPNQDHHGHGDALVTDGVFGLEGDFDLHGHPFALFPKGAGRPEDWFAATGNPYIYFSTEFAGPAWTCEFIDSDGNSVEVEDCDGPNYDHHHQQANEPCTFSDSHAFSKNPKVDPSLDPDSDGPVRRRYQDDLFVGRCVRWSETMIPLPYNVKCTGTDIPEEDLVVYPSCQSQAHNIGLGIGIDLINHHRIIASQISPMKFAGCTAAGVCDQGAGPHEAYDDDTCLQPPVLGVLIDKSAGSVQGEQPAQPESGVYTCYTGATNPGAGGSWDEQEVLTKPSGGVFNEFRRNSTQARHQSDFTACGVGGNPCVLDFQCTYGDGSNCFGDESDVLALLDCKGDDANQCGPDACRCATIRREVRETLVVSCYSEEGEEGHHHGEEGEDGEDGE